MRPLVAALCLLALALGAASGAEAKASRRSARARKAAREGVDPAHWFATQKGLIRVYQARAAKPVPRSEEAPDAAGASCEVVESTPKGEREASTRELCSMIVGKKPKGAATLTYELRPSGIFMVRAEAAGADKASTLERMLLPGPVRVGSKWKEPGAGGVLERRVKSAGKPCKAAGRSFGDCLVVAVVQRVGKKAAKKSSEIYAAGVGLVEDAKWQLIDVKGL